MFARHVSCVSTVSYGKPCCAEVWSIAPAHADCHMSRVQALGQPRRADAESMDLEVLRAQGLGQQIGFVNQATVAMCRRWTGCA